MRAAPPDWLDLSGKVCAVVGAAGPIGREIAARLAGAGATLLLLDRDAQGCGAAAAGAVSEDAPILAFACDTGDPASIAAAGGEAATLGTVDILVIVSPAQSPDERETLALLDWKPPLAVDLTASLVCVQEFGRPMLARGGGAIVLVASEVEPGLAEIASEAVRSGVTLLSRQIAVEWGPRGVRSNVVVPGIVHEGLGGAALAGPDGPESHEHPSPARRPGTPADVADAVLFLASERARHITGQEIAVGGGRSRTAPDDPRQPNGSRKPAPLLT